MAAGNPSIEEMEARTVRFSAGLNDFHKQHESKSGIPGEVFDRFAPNHVYPLLIPENYTGRSEGAALTGIPGLVIDLTVCPPHDGPVLHRHHETTENFMCLSGKFKISWGDDGENSIILNKYDFVSVPPGVFRTFENITDEPAYLLVLIQIPTEEQSDNVDLGSKLADDLRAEYGEEILDKLKGIGFEFDTATA